MLRLLTSVALGVAAFTASSADAAGVCYSPFYSSDYSSSSVASLLARDFQTIAAQGFDSVRTYHAQFFNQNVVTAAQSAGLKIAIGIQMVGTNGGEYAYLDQDIAAAIYAAKTAPQNVLAIYAGNENLQNVNWGSTSGDRIVEVIAYVKKALRGTPGEHIPVGTVQRLEEWLRAPDAAKVAAACDVVGANIYPFFTNGGASDMEATLSRQWSQLTSAYGGKARLTETGWPTQGSSVNGNVPSVANAAKYFAAFNNWASQTATESPFYFMMFDVPTAPGPNYEQHFGVASSSRVMKFLTAQSPAQGQGQGEAPSPAPVPAPTTSAPTSATFPIKETRDGLDFVPATVATLLDTQMPTEPPLVSVSTEELPTPEPTTLSPEPTTLSPEPTTLSPETTTATLNATTLPQMVNATVASTVAPTLNATVALTLNATVPPTPTPTPTKASTTAPATPAVVHHSSSSGSHGGDEIRFPSGSHAGTDKPSSASSKTGSGGASVGDGSAGVVPELPHPTTKSVPTSTPSTTPQTTAPHPTPTSGAGDATQTGTESPQVKAEIAAKEANSKVARDVAGENGSTVYALASIVGAAGVAAMVVVGVFMRRRNDEADHEIETRTVAASSIDPRASTPSVYDDPLGTRFSSIVMLTPNGDGVCIL